MYHHSTAKITKSNQYYRSKKLTASSGVSGKGSAGKVAARGGAVKTTVGKNSSKKAHRQTTTKTPAKQKKRFSSNYWLLSLSGVLKNIVIFLAVTCLLILVMVTALNFFAPRLFTLKEARKILFLTNENAAESKVLFVYFDAKNQMVSTTVLVPDLSVRVLGGYGSYPLRSLAALLKLEQKDQQSILAAYNFALDEVIDEVYFLDSLPDTEQKNALNEILRELILSHWQHYYQVPRNLLEAYFFLQTAPTVVSNQAIVKSDDLLLLRNGTYMAVSGGAACPMAVVNATKQGGLATRVADVLEKDGFWIARVATSEMAVDQTTLYYTEELDDQCYEVRQRLERIFPKAPFPILDTAQLHYYRVNLVLVLGDDMVD